MANRISLLVLAAVLAASLLAAGSLQTKQVSAVALVDAVQAPPPPPPVQITVAEAYMMQSWWEPNYMVYLEIKNNENFPIVLQNFTTQRSGQGIQTVNSTANQFILYNTSGSGPWLIPLKNLTIGANQTLCFGSEWMNRTPNCAGRTIQVWSHDFSELFSFAAPIGDCNSSAQGSFMLPNLTINYAQAPTAEVAKSDSATGRVTQITNFKNSTIGNFNISCYGWLYPVYPRN